MKECFFVHLEELSKKDMTEAMGKVKALITNSELTINQKGISQYSIHSYHRFISTTNNEDPTPTSKDDSDVWIIEIGIIVFVGEFY
jgi:phage/plasmid-associated DNA primase